MQFYSVSHFYLLPIYKNTRKNDREKCYFLQLYFADLKKRDDYPNIVELDYNGKYLICFCFWKSKTYQVAIKNHMRFHVKFIVFERLLLLEIYDYNDYFRSEMNIFL